MNIFVEKYNTKFMEIERLTTLAFSMYSNKGAYALLLGSGISRSAHIPSGWDVENKLIEQLAATQSVSDIKDWHQWYKEKYQGPATYSSLLEKLVTTPTERVGLMKPFFEPTDEEKDLALKEPTKAHRAIAKLAKENYIRVILTTNFDRLLERALEKEGVIPQVICHESDIKKSTPIVHSKVPTIIKINGDYIDCRFRNTTEELDKYPIQMKEYLCRIFEDYGLVTCGWSGNWDKGLIDIIENAPHSRYNSFFMEKEASDAIKALAASRNGETMRINGADDFFSELYEQVMALKKHDVNPNMSHDIMISKVKKYLSSEQYSIDYSDLIEKFGSEAYNTITAKANYNFTITPEQFSDYFELHYKAVKPLIDIAILAARWGKAYHIEAFGDILVKLCTKSFSAGESFTEGTQNLHALAPMLLLNTIGIACVKYNRFKELNNILKLSVPGGNFMGFSRKSLLFLLGEMHWNNETWNYIMKKKYSYPSSMFFLNSLRTVFKDYFVTGSEYENTFDIWERLKSLVFGHNKCNTTEFEVLIGDFIHKYKGKDQKTEPYVLFFKGADELKNDWEPIKQGMFEGNYDNYRSIFKQSEDYYIEYRTHWQ